MDIEAIFTKSYGRILSAIDRTNVAFHNSFWWGNLVQSRYFEHIGCGSNAFVTFLIVYSGHLFSSKAPNEAQRFIVATQFTEFPT